MEEQEEAEQSDAEDEDFVGLVLGMRQQPTHTLKYRFISCVHAGYGPGYAKGGGHRSGGQ